LKAGVAEGVEVVVAEAEGVEVVVAEAEGAHCMRWWRSHLLRMPNRRRSRFVRADNR